MTYQVRHSAMHLCFLLSVVLSCSASADLTGLWKFDDPNNLGLATVGTDLALTGVSTPISGIDGVGGADVAAEVGDSSYYTVPHGIAPNGGGTFANQYTLLMDINYPDSSAGNWLSLYQTNTGNSNDGDLFIRDSDEAVGLAALGGYSTNTTQSDTWYRVVLSVNNGVDRSVYVNGEQWLDGNTGSIDDRHSLDPVFLLFADENGDEDPIHISNLATWDETLNASAIAALGGPSSEGVIIPEVGPLTLRVNGGTGAATITNGSSYTNVLSNSA